MKKHERRAVDAVRRVLTPDLLTPAWRKRVAGESCPTAGHCYAAAEAVFHMLGGKEAGYKPMHLTTPDGPHWFVLSPSGEVIDPTADQFPRRPAYSKARGKGFLTRQPSKRAAEIIRRTRMRSNPNPDLRRLPAVVKSLGAKAWREIRQDPLRAVVVGSVMLAPIPGALVAGVALERVWRPRRGNPAGMDSWVLHAGDAYYLVTRNGDHIVEIEPATGRSLLKAAGAPQKRPSDRRTRRASGRSKTMERVYRALRRPNPEEWLRVPLTPAQFAAIEGEDPTVDALTRRWYGTDEEDMELNRGEHAVAQGLSQKALRFPAGRKDDVLAWVLHKGNISSDIAEGIIKAPASEKKYAVHAQRSWAALHGKILKAKV